LRKSHANSRVYWHFRSSVYSQFDKRRFFPINRTNLPRLGPLGSVIFGIPLSLLLFAQSLPPDGHVKSRGAGIASSDELSNTDERATLIRSGLET
jgi:hypothetical protein